MSWLIVRRCGLDWALPNAAKPRVQADGLAIGLCLGEVHLAVDEVVAVAGELRFRPPGLLAELWGERAAGVTVFRTRPVVVVDPDQPPRALVGGPVAENDMGEEGGGCND